MKFEEFQKRSRFGRDELAAFLRGPPARRRPVRAPAPSGVAPPAFSRDLAPRMGRGVRNGRHRGRTRQPPRRLVLRLPFPRRSRDARLLGRGRRVAVPEVFRRVARPGRLLQAARHGERLLLRADPAARQARALPRRDHGARAFGRRRPADRKRVGRRGRDSGVYDRERSDRHRFLGGPRRAPPRPRPRRPTRRRQQPVDLRRVPRARPILARRSDRLVARRARRRSPGRDRPASLGPDARGRPRRTHRGLDRRRRGRGFRLPREPLGRLVLLDDARSQADRLVDRRRLAAHRRLPGLGRQRGHRARSRSRAHREVFDEIRPEDRDVRCQVRVVKTVRAGDSGDVRSCAPTRPCSPTGARSWRSRTRTSAATRTSGTRTIRWPARWASAAS